MTKCELFKSVNDLSRLRLKTKSKEKIAKSGNPLTKHEPRNGIAFIQRCAASGVAD